MTEPEYVITRPCVYCGAQDYRLINVLSGRDIFGIAGCNACGMAFCKIGDVMTSGILLYNDFVFAGQKHKATIIPPRIPLEEGEREDCPFCNTCRFGVLRVYRQEYAFTVLHCRECGMALQVAGERQVETDEMLDMFQTAARKYSLKLVNHKRKVCDDLRGTKRVAFLRTQK